MTEDLEIRDIDGKPLRIGDKVIVEDYGGLFKAEVIKFCASTVKFMREKASVRIINFRNVPIKVYKL